MKTDEKNKLPTSNGAEPTAGYATVPIWLVFVFGVLLYWCQLYLDKHAGGFNELVYAPYSDTRFVESLQPVEEGGQMRLLGKKVYEVRANCQACHGANGLGSTSPLVPPLAKSEYVLSKKPDRLVRIVLHGLNGSITVAGKTFDGINMPAIGTLSELKDDEIAAVLTYVRQNKDWGNNASAVTPEQVKAIRDQVKARATQWTPEELSQIPD
jgi:mono/diheme cytochrome c family protein